MHAAGAGHLDHFGFRRGIDHFKEILCLHLRLGQRQRIFVAFHAGRRGIDDHVKFQLLQHGAVDDLGSGLLGQLLRRSGRTVQDRDFSAALFQSKDGGTCRASGAQHQDPCSLQANAHLQRTHNAIYVSIEAVEIAILAAHQRVAGADLGCPWIALVQLLQDRLFVRHGDAEAGNGNILHAGHQVFHGLGMQRQINGIYVFAAESGVQHRRGKGLGHGIAGHAVNARRGINLVNAIDVAQRPGG